MKTAEAESEVTAVAAAAATEAAQVLGTLNSQMKELSETIANIQNQTSPSYSRLPNQCRTLIDNFFTAIGNKKINITDLVRDELLIIFSACYCGPPTANQASIKMLDTLKRGNLTAENFEIKPIPAAEKYEFNKCVESTSGQFDYLIKQNREQPKSVVNIANPSSAGAPVPPPVAAATALAQQGTIANVKRPNVAAPPDGEKVERQRAIREGVLSPRTDTYARPMTTPTHAAQAALTPTDAAKKGRRGSKRWLPWTVGGIALSGATLGLVLALVPRSYTELRPSP